MLAVPPRRHSSSLQTTAGTTRTAWLPSATPHPPARASPTPTVTSSTRSVCCSRRRARRHLTSPPISISISIVRIIYIGASRARPRAACAQSNTAERPQMAVLAGDTVEDVCETFDDSLLEESASSIEMSPLQPFSKPPSDSLANPHEESQDDTEKHPLSPSQSYTPSSSTLNTSAALSAEVEHYASLHSVTPTRRPFSNSLPSSPTSSPSAKHADIRRNPRRRHRSESGMTEYEYATLSPLQTPIQPSQTKASQIAFSSASNPLHASLRGSRTSSSSHTYEEGRLRARTIFLEREYLTKLGTLKLEQSGKNHLQLEVQAKQMQLD